MPFAKLSDRLDGQTLKLFRRLSVIDTWRLKLAHFPRSLAVTLRSFAFCLAVPTARLWSIAATLLIAFALCGEERDARSRSSDLDSKSETVVFLMSADTSRRSLVRRRIQNHAMMSPWSQTKRSIRFAPKARSHC
jgi:hypothetical protein